MTKIVKNKTLHKSKPKISRNRAKPKKGLSIPTHLTAELKLKVRQNAECQLFIKESFGQKSTPPPNPKGRKKGQIIQNGLTRRGRRVIRIVSDCYNLLVNDKQFRQSRDVLGVYDGSSCRFITLTFRNIIPTDKEAKKLLDSFFKRLNRLFGRSIHYLWVAERQKRGAIHFHILTPENISKKITGNTTLSNYELRMIENTWINRAWNEVVKNWALKSGKVTKSQADGWQNEYNLSESYYKSKVNYQLGLRTTKPRKPKKSKYLLLPNCVHVFKAGNYMTKYMSKEGENIVGGMYGASQSSRDFLEAEVKVCKDFGLVTEANKAIRYMEKRAKMDKVFVYVGRMDFNESLTLWCKDYGKVLEWYFDYLELLKRKRKRKKRAVQLSII